MLPGHFMSDVSISHHDELSIQNYTLFLSFRNLCRDVETAGFPGEFGTTPDLTHIVISRATAERECLSVSELLCRAMCARGFPCGFRPVSAWRIGTKSAPLRANSPASSRPRRVRGQNGGGTLPESRGGRADTHGVVYTHDTLFFVEQSARAALN